MPFTFLSSEVVRFDKPLRFGARDRTTYLAQALLVRVRVPVGIYDQMPPDIEPFLYVGRRELRTFDVKPDASGDQLTITYYTRDVRPLARGAPMVITVEHGRPIRQQDAYVRRRDLARYPGGRHGPG